VDWSAADVPPSAWPNNTTGVSRFQKWSAKGALLWSVGLHTAEKNRPSGQFAAVRGILGEVRDCLVVMDACEPASVWTHDGLFAGSLCGARANDGLPDVAYSTIFRDDNQWGLVMQTPQGDVLWGGMSDNSTPIYRVHGWENWESQSGKFIVARPTTSAHKKGAGLQAEYFASSDLTGAPAFIRLDQDLWFGPMWGDHRSLPARKSWFGRGQSPAIFAGAFSARWRGFLESPLTESFSFVIYTYGVNHGGNVMGSKVRLWIDGRPVIDEWEKVKFQRVDGWWRTRACISKPITLSAGRLVPIRLEYAAAGGEEAHLHLFFESNSLDQRHVPQSLLYPDKL
jgi:hypothetical protein